MRMRFSITNKLAVLFLITFFSLPIFAATQMGKVASLCVMTFDSDFAVYGHSLRDRNSVHGDPDPGFDVNPTGSFSEGTFFHCNPEEIDEMGNKVIMRTLEGEIITPSTENNNKAYLVLPYYNEVSSAEMKSVTDGSFLTTNGTSHQQAQRVYLDGIPGKKIQTFNKPGMTWKDNQAGRSKGVEVLTVGESSKAIFVKDTKWVPNYNDPVLRHNVGRMFYKVDVIDNDKETIKKYLQGEKIENGSEGWLDSEFTRSDELKKSPETPAEEDNSKTVATDKPCKECAKKEELKEQIEDISLSTGIPANITSIADLIAKNSCFPQSVKEIKRISAPHKNFFDGYQKSWNRSRIKGNTANFSNSELKAIDAFARTLYGEMRSCHADLGSRYSKAVARVVLNRAEKCMKISNCEFTDSKFKSTSLADAVLGVVSKNKQFSVWNMGDRNNDDILCIIPEDKKIWRESVMIATDAILNNDKFKSNTSSMGSNTYHYVSATGALKWKDPSWASGKPRKKNIFIDGYPVDKASCIRAYQTI